MSCYLIFYKDGAKMMRPVLTAAEYRNLRDTEKQKQIVCSVRNGNEKLKHRLLQMNYSCLPSASTDNSHAGCGPLKGSTTPSNTVGMDVDLHRDDYASDEAYRDALAAIPEKVMAKKEELGLLMLERSATKGYHLAFTRRTELTQEENLRWASDLLVWSLTRVPRISHGCFLRLPPVRRICCFWMMRYLLSFVILRSVAT